MSILEQTSTKRQMLQSWVDRPKNLFNVNNNADKHQKTNVRIYADRHWMNLNLAQQ